MAHRASGDNLGPPVAREDLTRRPHRRTTTTPHVPGLGAMPTSRRRPDLGSFGPTPRIQPCARPAAAFRADLAGGLLHPLRDQLGDPAVVAWVAGSRTDGGSPLLASAPCASLTRSRSCVWYRQSQPFPGKCLRLDRRQARPFVPFRSSMDAPAWCSVTWLAPPPSPRRALTVGYDTTRRGGTCTWPPAGTSTWPPVGTLHGHGHRPRPSVSSAGAVGIGRASAAHLVVTGSLCQQNGRQNAVSRPHLGWRPARQSCIPWNLSPGYRWCAPMGSRTSAHPVTLLCWRCRRRPVRISAAFVRSYAAIWSGLAKVRPTVQETPS